MLDKVYELKLRAPVARLEVREGVVVSVLQPDTRAFGTPEQQQSAPGSICVHHPATLQPRELVEFKRRIGAVRLDASVGKLAVLTFEVGTDPDAERALHVLSIDGEELARRSFDDVLECDWWQSNVVLGLCNGSYDEETRVAAEIWTPDLSERIDLLEVREFGLDLAVAGDLIASCGIDVHLWWPKQGRSVGLYKLFDEFKGELGPAALSADGRLVAVAHHALASDEPQVCIAKVNALEEPLVTFSDGRSSDVDQLAFSPDGSKLALHFAEAGDIFVCSPLDGQVLASAVVSRSRTMAWLDDETLLVGGERLSAFRLS